MIYVDASTVVSALLNEPEAERVVDVMSSGGRFVTSPVGVFEMAAALSRTTNVDPSAAADLVRRFLERFDVEVVELRAEHAIDALGAFARFGKGRHPARLNMGDCFAYATARSLDAAILFVGDDFTRTDLAAASPRAQR